MKLIGRLTLPCGCVIEQAAVVEGSTQRNHDMALKNVLSLFEMAMERKASSHVCPPRPTLN
jgi:hypothetical protein